MEEKWLMRGNGISLSKIRALTKLAQTSLSGQVEVGAGPEARATGPAVEIGQVVKSAMECSPQTRFTFTHVSNA